MKSAANARRCPGLTARAGSASVATTIRPRFVEPALERQGEHRQRDGRLGEGRDRHLAARAHAPERGAGIEAGQRQEERAQEEQVHEDDQVAHRVERERRRQHRHQGGHRDRAGEDDERRGPEEPGGVPGDHDLLPEELPQLEIRLPERRPPPVLQPRLHPADQPHQSRAPGAARATSARRRPPSASARPSRHQQEQDEGEDHVEQVEVERSRPGATARGRPSGAGTTRRARRGAARARGAPRSGTRSTGRSISTPGGSRSRDPRSGGRARRRRAGAAPRTRSPCTPSGASGRCGRSPRCRPRGGADRRRRAGRPRATATDTSTSPAARAAGAITPAVPGISSVEPGHRGRRGRRAARRARPPPRPGPARRAMAGRPRATQASASAPIAELHGQGYLPRLGRAGRAGHGEKRDAEGLHEARRGQPAGEGEHPHRERHEHAQLRSRQLRPAQERLEHQPLGDEAVQRRQPGDGGRAHEEAQGRAGHALDEPAQLLHVARVRRVQHRARRRERAVP